MTARQASPASEPPVLTRPPCGSQPSRRSSVISAYLDRTRTHQGRHAHHVPPAVPPGHGEGGTLDTRMPPISTGRPGRALRARLHLVREPAPHGRAEPQHRPGTVLRVPHEDHARSVAYFHAVTATVAGVTGRSPARLYVVFHCSAAFKMRSRDASRDSASPRTRLNAALCLRTSERFSVV